MTEVRNLAKNAEYLGPEHLRLNYDSYGNISKFDGRSDGRSDGRKGQKRQRKKELPADVVPILSFDPGGTTGWSLLVLQRNWGTEDVFNLPQDVMLRSKSSWFHGQIDCMVNEDAAVHVLLELIDEWPSAAIVVEDFILRTNRREMNRELLSPVRITAKIEHHLWRNGRKMWLQAPSQAKSLGTDDRLKAWGVYTSEGGLGHARDADRHAMLFMRRCMGQKGSVTRALAWSHIYKEIQTVPGVSPKKSGE